jgi:hypothetical protein
VLLSAASALSYLGYVGQGIVVGDLLGIRGRGRCTAAGYLLVGGLCVLFGRLQCNRYSGVAN